MHAKKRRPITQKQLREKARDLLVKALAGDAITQRQLDAAIGVLHVPERKGE